MTPKPEPARSIARGDFEFRTLPDGKTRFTGYAAVYNTDSEPLPFVETVRPSAFTRSLGGKTNHTFVLNHDDNLLLASRRTERLRLGSDERGLLVDADLPDTSYASDLRSLDAVGEVWGMSFTFRAARDGAPYSDGGSRRELRDVSLGHVTVLTGLQPAYPATTGTTSIRTLADAAKVAPQDVEALLDAIRDGEPLDARAYQLLLNLTVQLNPAADEPDADDAAEADEPGEPADPMPMMAAGRTINEWKASLRGRGIHV